MQSSRGLFSDLSGFNRCFSDEEAALENKGLVLPYLRAKNTARDYRLAQYCVDLVQEKRPLDGPPRKDHTPSLFHEAGIFLDAGSIIESGLISDAVRSKYGPSEIILCLAAVHDRGEDDGLTSGQLDDYLTERARKDGLFTEVNTAARTKRIIDATCEGMERLTYKRNGVFIHGEDLNLYHDVLLGDPYALIIKFVDRPKNLATMLPLLADPENPGKMMGGFTLPQQQSYLDRTEMLFSIRDMAKEATAKYPELKEVFTALDDTLKVLYRIGRLQAHNLEMARNNEASGAYKPAFSSLSQLAHLGEEIRSSERLFSSVPPGFHSLTMMARRIEKQPYMHDDKEGLKVLRRIREESAKGIKAVSKSQQRYSVPALRSFTFT